MRISLIGFLLVSALPSGANYDLLFRNATLVDGSGAAAVVADVGIRDGVIAEIGDELSGEAGEVIDASGLVLAPGFIDVHSHADGALRDPETAGLDGFLMQGVTTAVFGVDGSLATAARKNYIALAEAGGVGINFMTYVGHNSIRREVMGYERRPPTVDEMTAMKALVTAAMEEGAVGLSTGLMYQPGTFAETTEVIELAKAVRSFGGRYDSHVRDPANRLIESHTEALDVAAAAGVAAHPAHVKAVGAANFGLGGALVELFQERVDSGQEVTIDVYPYDGASTRPMVALLRPGDDRRGRELDTRARAIESGAAPMSDIPQLIEDLLGYWAAVLPGTATYEQAVVNTERPPDGAYSWVGTVGYQSMRVVVSENPDNVGVMLPDLAEQRGVAPFELVRQMVVEEQGAPMVTLGAILEEEVQLLLKQPWTMVASDGEELAPMHPRGRGTFARVLGRYVREWGVLELEEAVYKMTGLPARFVKLDRRGIVMPGYVADITVFDPRTIIDHATWAAPERYAEGVVHVLIGGQFAVRDGAVAQDRHGRFIPFRGVAD